MSDPLIRTVFLAHMAATLLMTGVIWFVQVVHYPLFADIGKAGFSSYEQRHTALTTWVVGPPMFVEAATAVLLFWFRPAGILTWQLGSGLALLAIVWLSTAFFQVPCHELLSKAFEPSVHERLVVTNWIRTAAWSLRALLVIWMAWSSSS
ncbi:MAG TPA: hypothetical protein VJY33_04115 [Isosphaeraceae bacterium]|nr:hypothetical protein [Isosphaeraceae bacterium]